MPLKPRKPKRTFKNSRKMKPQVPDAVKAYVKKAIAVEIENKSQTYTQTGPIVIGNASNTTVWSTSNVWMLTPNSGELSITQGVTQGTRVGNKIKIKTAKLIVHLTPNGYVASGNQNTVPSPQYIDIYIFKLRTQTDSIASARTVSLSSFFQNGASAVGFVGNGTDWMHQINNEQVKVYYHKRFKIGYADYSSNTGHQAEANDLTNNDFNLSQIIEIDMMKNGYPKHMIFEDNNVIAQQDQLYFLANPVDFDGTLPANPTTCVPANMLYSINVTYEDA